MPIKKAAFKHFRQTKKRTARNALVRNRLVQFVKQVKKAIRGEDSARIAEYLKEAQKIIDKAAQARVIKKNTASRKKSRLIRAMQSHTKV